MSSTTTSTTLRIPGDADGDGRVGYRDLVILASSYGKRRGETGFDSRADYNGDNVINYSDLVVLASYYGR